MENVNLEYTLGFIFNADLHKVLLVHKQKPDWQSGHLNGIGGKLNQGESPVECISRETFEESKLAIPLSAWKTSGVIQQSVGNVGIFCAIYRGNLSDAAQGDYEEVEWFDVEQLPKNVLDNLRWIIPLALEVLQAEQPIKFSVWYS